MQYETIINQMTLAEKCALLSGGTQFTTKEIKRLGVPKMTLSDGPHGVRKQAGAADHLGLNASLPATCFPTAATVANAWDETLSEALGARLGAEARAQEVNVLLGPGLNVKRSPLCGRSFEYFSEDPYLAGKMAAAYIRGIQSKGVSACPKHFAVNSQETLRMHSDSILDERTLREIYLTGFEIAVKESKPLSIMSSYNRINGIYASEHETLLNDILMKEWGFDGFSVTDWGGSNDRVEGVKAGTHLEMPTTGGDSDRAVMAAVEAGSLSEALLDQRVDEYLKVLFATTIDDATDFDVDAHHAFAQKVAEQAIVLLKNDDQILPLKAKTRVAVIGDFADKPRYQGAGSSVVNPTKLDTPLICLEKSALDVVGFAQGFRRHGGEDSNKLLEAVALAKHADVVLLYMGLDEILESEGLDRNNMKIRKNQITLLEAVSDANPNVVVVFAGGAPVELPFLAHCKAFVNGYLGGQAGAQAMVNVLTGDVNPSGKLTETWPIAYEDTPAYQYYPGKEKTAEYRESLFVGYRYYNTAQVPVRFPFGFGLSYTSFAYSDLVVKQNEVTFSIANTGKSDGSEVAQLYIGLKDSDVFRSREELKGFQKVHLKAGEKQAVTIKLDDKAFRFFNPRTNAFEIEKGMYDVTIGSSSQDIKLQGRLEVAGTSAAGVYDTKTCWKYGNGDVQDITDNEFEALLGRKLPQALWDRSLPLGMNDTFAQLFYAKGWVGRLVGFVLTRLKNNADKKGTPNLNILFIYNMPFRGIAKMMGAMVNMEMAEAILHIFNGHFFAGCGRLIKGFVRKGRAGKKMAQRLEAPLQAGKGEQL